MIQAGRTEPRPLVLIPTYNERANLEPLVAAVLAAQPGFDVLVIDDKSPDGTGDLARDLAARDGRIHVLHGPEKRGLARAYLGGFAWALAAERGYTHVFEMDADFSHDPAYLEPLLRACIEGADVAVGSRYVPGGGSRGWGLVRRLVSRAGGLYARLVLGVAVQDLTAGFVCYTRNVLEALPLDDVLASGYGFQIEMKYRCLRHGFSIREVPIVFAERTRGASKMSAGILLEALHVVWKIRMAKSR